MTVNLALFPHDRDCPTLRVPAERVECVCTRAYFAELLSLVRLLQSEVAQLRDRKCPCQRVYGGWRYTEPPEPVEVPPGWTTVPGADGPVLVPDLKPVDHTRDVPPHTHGGTDAAECTTCAPAPMRSDTSEPWLNRPPGVLGSERKFLHTHEGVQSP